MTPQRERPPLWTWAAAVVLAAILLGGVIVTDQLLQPVILADQMHLDRFRQPAGRPWVLLVGASRVHCGVEFDTDMEARLARAGVKAGFVRLARSAGDWQDIRYAFERAESAPHPPALVLVESDLILYQPHVYNDPAGPPLPWQFNLIRDIPAFHGPMWHENDRRGGDCGKASNTVFSPSDLAAERRVMNAARISTPAERAPWLDSLRRLRARGAGVAMIDLQRDAVANAMRPPRLLADTDALASALAADGFVVLAPPVQSPDTDFIDFGHRNAAGRAAYSAWLTGEIVRRLAAGR